MTPGDLLTVGETGQLRAASVAADATVAGIAAGEPVEIDGRPMVSVATFGIIEVKVDADYGAIRPGDLLSTSATTGHAMRAFTEIPGTVIAKALESFESGRGVIRAVVVVH